MKQNKFRGQVLWNGQHYFSGDMVEGYFFRDHNSKPFIRVNEYQEGAFCRTVDIEVKPGTVGQFTGLKDKNGVEIYEGDMLGCKGNVVEFSNGCFNVNGDRSVYWMKELTIVGNVHEEAL